MTIDVRRLRDAIAAHQTKVRAFSLGEPCVPQCARDIAVEYAALEPGAHHGAAAQMVTVPDLGDIEMRAGSNPRTTPRQPA